MEKQKDEISAKHPKYDNAKKLRDIFCDVMGGTAVLREKAKTYILQNPGEKDSSYDIRCKQARVFNMTKKTVDVMCGLVFKGEIKLGSDVPAETNKLWENIDNAGTIGNVFAQDMFEDYFEGYAVILTDAPNAENLDSLETQQALGIRPYWKGYCADDIWNWSYRINPISKSKELELIVLREINSERVGEYIFEDVTRYRKFKIDENNQIRWELYKEVKNKKGEISYEPEHPDNNILENLTEIPVAVLGELGDKPRLLDIAYANLDHADTYSYYKSDIRKTCAPMLTIENFDGDQDSEKIVGADIAWFVNQGGDVRFAEVKGESIPNVRITLQDIQEEIALMGLSLLADKTAKVDVTATEALLNNIGETAELRVMAQMLKDALELSLGHIAQYLGKGKDMGGSIELQTAWANENQAVDTSGGMNPNQQPNGQQANELVN